MKKILFTTLLLLAVASLGLALPQSAVPTPPAPAPTSPVPTLPKGLVSTDSINAVLGGKLTPECSSAILTIITSPEFLKCIPVPAFVPLLPIVTDPTFLGKLTSDPAGTFKQIEPALVKFATDFCPTQKCSDKDVAGAIKILGDGCKEDLKNNPLIQLLFGVTVFYSPIHDTVCFESQKGGKFCWDESLTTIFGLPKSPIKIVDGGLIDSIAVADPFAICTRCNKDIVNTFANFLKGNDLALQILAQLHITDKTLELAKVGVAVKCGIDFEDGKIPDKP